MTEIRIDVACNDPDNGIFAGAAEYIQLPDQLLGLAAKRSPAPRFTEGVGTIRICRRWWPIRGSKDWYDNWCWNAYWLNDDIATKLICALHRSGLYDCEVAEARLANLWRLDAPLDAEFLNRQMVKSMLAEARS